ncbi:unnamed protein product [Paramecium octaurelia]|uniref:5-oxoprolinase n=1 Tax=Paramecium octaurelia TaxID=43137 RepID=A0A8S1VJA8_PAROT|nr:unnamed protein product [Paramecium octaurelia]
MLNFYIDRGGTFTDVFYQLDGESKVHKLLSQSYYKDGVFQGIKEIYEKYSRDGSNVQVNQIVIGTTIITNAILEKQGHDCALLITEGFRDLLQIGQQTRPKIFDLTMKKPSVLYKEVIEIKERITYEGEIVQSLDLEQVRTDLLRLKQQKISSIAVVLLHSVINDVHEQQIKGLAKEVGFCSISISSEVSKVIKVVPRGQTTVLNSYVNPLIQQYIQELEQEIRALLTNQNPQILFMQSDGGLTEAQEFIGSKAVLSGPAGGVVALMQSTKIFKQLNKKGVVGLDMGGTSTDVCVYYDRQNIKEESVVDGIIVNTPCFDIKTVAAGGGSLLKFENGMFKVGPTSSGSYPGPICYDRDGLLSLTDANLYLGNIDVDHLPKIFGFDNNSGLNYEKVKEQFEAMSLELGMSPIEIAESFIKVADEQMCRPIRQITNGRGQLSQDHLLVIYGGAGGQHCCSIAESLMIDSIFIHKYASIFSAYGLSLARQQKYQKIPLIDKLINFDSINKVINTLQSQQQQDIEQLIELHLKYEGSDFLLKIEYNSDVNVIKQSFEMQHHEFFGFKQNREILIEYVSVTTKYGQQKEENDELLEIVKVTNGINMNINQLQKQIQYKGPFLIHTGNTTIKINSGWQAELTRNENIVIRKIIDQQNINQSKYANSSLELSIFANKFMSIAEEMGLQLQNTAVSINIKERLDFSCAIFDKDGNLVANAPHLPVHLGSMSDAVKCQINNFNEGDIIMSNHPEMGGSHLPDITIITPYFKDHQKLFYVASRGHHADIGGISPGSMPAFSKYLKDEGIAVRSFKIVENGVFQEDKLIELLQESREKQDNVQDLKAQIAANNKGIQLIEQLITQEGYEKVDQNMKRIQENGENCVRQMLYEISIKNNLKEIDTIESDEYMDDGSKINLKLTINRQDRSVIFDFTGTSQQVLGNTNCPVSVTKSAIIYCLRCLVDMDIPLNQGCLNPTQIIIPKNSLLSPNHLCAIVGGNVLTSQRITDLILKCFQATAASQGCMNNFSFGGFNQRSYYETIGGGSGAGDGFNGESGVQVHMTNTRITDVEIIERKHPVRILSFTLRPNSHGKGKYSGGDGIIRSFLFLTKLNVSLLTERRVFPPFGLKGGQNGQKGINLYKTQGQSFLLSGKVNLDVLPDDEIWIYTPGGGGYGLI